MHSTEPFGWFESLVKRVHSNGFNTKVSPRSLHCEALRRLNPEGFTQKVSVRTEGSNTKVPKAKQKVSQTADAFGLPGVAV